MSIRVITLRELCMFVLFFDTFVILFLTLHLLQFYACVVMMRSLILTTFQLYLRDSFFEFLLCCFLFGLSHLSEDSKHRSPRGVHAILALAVDTIVEKFATVSANANIFGQIQQTVFAIIFWRVAKLHSKLITLKLCACVLYALYDVLRMRKSHTVYAIVAAITIVTTFAAYTLSAAYHCITALTVVAIFTVVTIIALNTG